MVVELSSVGRSHRAFWLCTLVALILTIAVGYGLWQHSATQPLPLVHERLQPWLTGLRLLQWLAIAAVACGWRSGVRWLMARGRLSKRKVLELTAARPRILLWLIVLQLALGGDWLLTLFGHFSGDTL